MNELADSILVARSADRGGPALTDSTDALTNRELVAAAHARATEVAAVTAHRQPMVAVSLPLSTETIVHLLAAILGDYGICFLDPSAHAGRADAIVDALGPDVIVNGSGIRAVGNGRRGGAPIEPGYVAMSSGSTGGAPKGVLSPWTTVAAFAAPAAAALEVDADARWAEISHPAYDMAITNLLVALVSGADIRLSGALGDRLRPMRFITRAAASHVRLAPRFVDLAVAERRGAEGHRLRVWGSGGDRFRRDQVEQLFTLGIPLVVNTYGTSETSGFASFARLTAGDDIADVQGSVPIGRGRVGAWQTDLVTQNDASMLRIRSPHLPHGYLFGEPDDYPQWTDDACVLTGDVGVRLGDDLYCLGRAGRRVKRNGSFVDLDGIDAVVREAMGIASFTVMSPSGALWSLVEQAEDRAVDLRRELSARLRPEMLPDAVRAVPALPRLDNGKIDHAAAAALVDGVSAPDAR